MKTEKLRVTVATWNANSLRMNAEILEHFHDDIVLRFRRFAVPNIMHKAWPSDYEHKVKNSYFKSEKL